MLLSGGKFKPPPVPIDGIERKKWLKLLGVTFEDDVCCWDLHVDGLVSKAGSRMYILSLEYVEGMDIRRNILAISLTQLYCRYFYMALKFGARPCKRNIWIALPSFLSEHIDMVMF